MAVRISHGSNISPNLVLRSDAPGVALDSIVGSYRIVKQIGVGGMATVFEAKHLLLLRRVAIKVMHPQLRGDSGWTPGWSKPRILDQIYHPGVARISIAVSRPMHAVDRALGRAGDHQGPLVTPLRAQPMPEPFGDAPGLAQRHRDAHLHGQPRPCLRRSASDPQAISRPR